jgi:hypothetical protein
MTSSHFGDLFHVRAPLPINNVENIIFDKPWPQNRFNNIAQGGGGGGGQELLLQEGEGQ